MSYRLNEVSQSREDSWQIHLKKAKDLTERIKRPQNYNGRPQNFNDQLVNISRDFFASVKHAIVELPRGSNKWRDYRQGKYEVFKILAASFFEYRSYYFNDFDTLTLFRNFLKSLFRKLRYKRTQMFDPKFSKF